MRRKIESSGKPALRICHRTVGAQTHCNLTVCRMNVNIPFMKRMTYRTMDQVKKPGMSPVA
jgi:hypothetical protein